MSFRPYKVISASGLTLLKQRFEQGATIYLTESEAKYYVSADQIVSLDRTDVTIPPIVAPEPVPVTETNAKITVTLNGVQKNLTIAELINTFPRLKGEKGVSGEKGEKGETGASIKVVGAVNTPDDLPPEAELNSTYTMLTDGADFKVGDGYTFIGIGYINVGPIRGPIGPQGERGEKGEKGERGEKGEDGIQGERGPEGQRGPAGVAGERGFQGDRGPTGAKGEPGKDGLNGANGATIIPKGVPPTSADGKDGDYYIEDRTASGQGRRMWGPKAGGVWPGTPWNIQVAAIGDVPGLTGALDSKAPNRITPTGGATERILADWLQSLSNIYRGDPENSVFKLEIDDRVGTTTRFYMLAGNANSGPTLTAIGGSNPDAPMAFIAPGKGSLIFGNGGGRILEIRDDGSGQHFFQKFFMQAGALNVSPRLGSNFGMDFEVVPGRAFTFFNKDGQTDYRIGQFGTVANNPTMYPRFYAGTDTVRITADSATLTNVPFFFQTKGTGQHSFYDGNGLIARFIGVVGADNAINFTNANGGNALIQASKTDGAITLSGNGAGVARVRRPELGLNITMPFSDAGVSVAGGTTTLSLDVNATRIFRPAGAISGYTIVLPPDPADGTIFRLTSTNTISNITWSLGAGDAIRTNVGTTLDTTMLTLVYCKSIRTWSKG